MTIQNVQQGLEAASPGEPVAPNDRDLADQPNNDLGNARRLIARHGEDFLVVDELQRDLRDGWLVWDGTRWAARGAWAQVKQMAHRTSEAIYDEAEAVRADPPKQWPDEGDKAYADRLEKRIGGLNKHALDSGNSTRVNAMLNSAVPYRLRMVTGLDADPMLLNVRNGTLVLGAEVRLRPHDRSDLISRLVPVDHDPEADCPKFRAFLARILPVEEVRVFLQIWFGYCLTGSIAEQLAVLFYGRGANGKSTLLKILRALFGDYALSIPFETLTHDERKSGSQPTPDLVRLVNVRFAAASEPGVGTRLSESMLKSQTGGEPMVVRQLYREPFEFLPTHKLVSSFNNKPKITAQDEGTWRRLAMVPFTVIIPREERVDDFADQLVAEEAAGILNWLLDGYRLWRERGLVPPEQVMEATSEYRGESDRIGDFLAACTEPDRTRATSSADLYGAYERYCKENRQDAISHALFGRLMIEKGFQRSKSMGRMHYHKVSLTREALEQAVAPSSASEGAPRAPPPESEDDYRH